MEQPVPQCRCGTFSRPSYSAARLSGESIQLSSAVQLLAAPLVAPTVQPALQLASRFAAPSHHYSSVDQVELRISQFFCRQPLRIKASFFRPISRVFHIPIRAKRAAGIVPF